MKIFWDSFNLGTYVKESTIERKKITNPGYRAPTDSPYLKQLRRIDATQQERSNND